MRYKINVPKHLFHETFGLMADLNLQPRGKQNRGEIFVEIDDRTSAYLIVFPRLFGPAGLTFDPAEESPAEVPKARVKTKRRRTAE